MLEKTVSWNPGRFRAISNCCEAPKHRRRADRRKFTGAKRHHVLEEEFELDARKTWDSPRIEAIFGTIGVAQKSLDQHSSSCRYRKLHPVQFRAISSIFHEGHLFGAETVSARRRRLSMHVRTDGIRCSRVSHLHRESLVMMPGKHVIM